jgi:hypothetical protein
MTLASLALCGLAAVSAQPDPQKTRVYRQAAEMDYGPCIAATVGVAKNNITPKGLVIRVDRETQAYVLFDTELLRVTAAWKGGWLQLAGRAYADDSNDYPWIKGELQYVNPARPGCAKGDAFEDPRPAPHDGPLPADWGRFRGVYLHGERVVLSYVADGSAVLETHGFDGGVFRRRLDLAPSGAALKLLLAPGDSKVVLHGPPAGVKTEAVGAHVYLHVPPHREALQLVCSIAPAAGDVGEAKAEALEPFTKGGPARWRETPVTAGVVGKTPGPFVVDTLTVPDANPYKSWLRFTGLDFFPDGRAALCTWSGDVWIVSGIDAGLEKLTWKRFATGIGQPMGLKIVDGRILTVARDQITRLHDLDGDGEADFYECVNNGIKLTTNFHEFCFDLQTDSEGNFWCTKGSPIWAGSLRMTDHSGSVCKIAKDGSKLEIVATGLRAPNGLGISPEGDVYCTDNQGNWVPECPINRIRPGGFYGFLGPGQAPRERERPLTWIPMSVDKSSGGLVWVPDDRWGLPKGAMILNSYDCSVSLVLRERGPEGEQGGVVRFPIKFPSGVMRGRFNPADGQLYVAGLRGWSSSAVRDCSFQRLRYAGGPVTLPLRVVTRKGGLDVAWSGALDAASVADPEKIGAVGFNVVRSDKYGSTEFSLKDPKKSGRDPIEIRAAKLQADGKTVSLEIPDLRPMTNLVLKFRLKAAGGEPVQVELDYTLHWVPD